MWLDHDFDRSYMHHYEEHRPEYHVHDYYYHDRSSHPTAFDGSPILPSAHGFPEHRGMGGHYYDQDEHHGYDIMSLNERYELDVDIHPEGNTYNVTTNPYGSVHSHWNIVKYTHQEENAAIPSLTSMKTGAG